MVDQKKLILQVPLAYYRELKVIADKNIIHPNQLAERVVLTFVDNMRQELYPIITDLNKEESSQPTNTDADPVKP